MTEPSPAVDIEGLVADLRHRLEERQRAGQYPPGLENQLDEHARLYAARRVKGPDPFPPLREAVEAVVEKHHIYRNEIEPTSSVPLGSLAHRAADKLQRRQLDSLIAQVSDFAVAVTSALERSIDVLLQPPHDYDAVLEQLDGVLERIAALEGGAAAGGALGSLLERVERLEAAERDRRFRPFFSNMAFEAAFRGSDEDLRDRYTGLADELVGFQPVLDIGCGQGLLLELLEERHVVAAGVELDAELARVCRAKGLHVEERDGIGHLLEQEDGSLGAIVLLQVIEHLSHQHVADLFLIARQKLRPGGLLAIESVNPQSLYVFARAFYVDPTHTTPVHPAYVVFLAQEAGFSSHRLEWRSPVPVDEALLEETESAARLNRLVFGPQDYLFLGVR